MKLTPLIDFFNYVGFPTAPDKPIDYLMTAILCIIFLAISVGIVIAVCYALKYLIGTIGNAFMKPTYRIDHFQVKGGYYALCKRFWGWKYIIVDQGRYYLGNFMDVRPVEKLETAELLVQAYHEQVTKTTIVSLDVKINQLKLERQQKRAKKFNGKPLIFAALLLSVLVSRGQTTKEISDSLFKIKLERLQKDGVVLPGKYIPTTVATLPYAFEGWRPLDSAKYDTVMVIAEVYKLPHKMEFGGHMVWDKPRKLFVVVTDSIWCWEDSTEVHTRKVIAWEVWRKEWQKVDVSTGLNYEYYYTWVRTAKVKILAYNRKDELTKVLQTWRPKEFETNPKTP